MPTVYQSENESTKEGAASSSKGKGPGQREVHPKVILHLGFHKTASTAIQAKLDQGVDEAKKRKHLIVKHRRFRNCFMRPVELYSNQMMGMDFGEKVDKRTVDAYIYSKLGVKQWRRFRKITISEENAAGHVGQCAFTGGLYRFPKKYLVQFRDFLPIPASEIHVVVRRYDTFLASCYLEYLGSASSRRYIPPEVMMAKARACPPNWASLLRILKKVFETARINVWVYEEIDLLMRPLLSALVDEEFAKTSHSDMPVLRKTAGRSAFESFTALQSREGTRKALEEWSKIKKKNLGGESFDPWSPRDRAHLSELYKKDLEAIANMPGIELHRARPFERGLAAA